MLKILNFKKVDISSVNSYFKMNWLNWWLKDAVYSPLLLFHLLYSRALWGKVSYLPFSLQV